VNEDLKSPGIEQAMVFDWVANISEKQEVGEMPREILKEVEKSFGANFEIGEVAKESLKGYSEKQVFEGMKEVWGEKYEEYKKWINEDFIPNYEKQIGKELPALVKQKDSTSLTLPSGRKDSGMKQFLIVLTRKAAGTISDEDFKSDIETRIKNGVAWSEGRKDDRVRIKVPTAEKPILIGSFPKEFPVKAFEWLKNNT